MDVSAFFDIPQTSMDTNGRRLSKTSMTCTFGKSDAGFSSKKIRKNQVRKGLFSKENLHSELRAFVRQVLESIKSKIDS